jgi:TetR/AcrR family transcriptional regulator
MAIQEKNTENIIFDAAKEVFTEKGFEGTRMQEIAEKASINKALLHYYYRTKEKLFNAIFERVFGDFIPKVANMLESDVPLVEKIRLFVVHYIEFIMRNPQIPSFIMHELSRNPQRAVDLIAHKSGLIKNNAFGKFAETVRQEVEKGNIEPIEPEQLIVNVIGLCIFPFVAKPILMGIIFKNDKKKYNEFLELRKQEVANFVIAAISKKK